LSAEDSLAADAAAHQHDRVLMIIYLIAFHAAPRITRHHFSFYQSSDALLLPHVNTCYQQQKIRELYRFIIRINAFV